MTWAYVDSIPKSIVSICFQSRIETQCNNDAKADGRHQSYPVALSALVDSLAAHVLLRSDWTHPRAGFRIQHAGSDSNTQPADLESAALPIELLAFSHKLTLAG